MNPPCNAESAAALTARGLGLRFGERVVFRRLDFEVPAGRVAAITGNNGAGKSSLLKIAAGLLRPAVGTLEFRAADLVFSGAKLPGICGLFAPDAPVYRELTVFENLEFFACVRGVPGRKSLEAHLEKFALSARREDLAGDLSSGWRARLQLAVATLHHPPVLLLDEPSANLDEAGRALLREVLEQQRQRGLALLATNDARDLELCNLQVELR